MKIAIHPRTGSFSDRWIEYCKINKIPFKLVNCFKSDIIYQLKACDGLLWHWDQNDYRSKLFAKQLTISLEKLNIKSFPDVNTSWHFDDKLGQKYLFESLGLPHILTYAFYTRKEALLWINKAKYPKVFKLRSGAGAVNVRLVKNKCQARNLINKAFSTGFKHINRWTSFKDSILKFNKQNDLKTGLGILKGFARFIIPTEVEKMSGKQKGYVYFQDYIPGNEYDTRLYVIGNRCFGTRRYNRKNDFRASGSNIVKNQRELFDPECIKLAFDIAEKLRTQSLACDFLIHDGIYKVVEISYCFPADNTINHPGYWDRELNWHNAKIIPQYFMIEDLIKSIC